MRLSKKIISFTIASCMALSAVISALAVTTVIEKGLKLSVESVEGKTAVVVVEAVGYDSVGSFDLTITSSTNTFAEQDEPDSLVTGMTLINGGTFVDTSTNELGFSGYNKGTKQDTSSNAVLAKVTVEFNEDITSDSTIEISRVSEESLNTLEGDDVPDFTLYLIEEGDPTPVVEAALESVTGADEPIITGYKDETMNVDLAGTADIFKITATANDYNTGAITGLTVSVEGNEKNVDTAIAANDNVVIAVVIGYKDGVSKGFKPTVTAIVE